MSITYTTEAKHPLLDNGSGNWGAVINGVFTQIDKGMEVTLVAGETIVANDAICIASDGTGMKADADDATRRPCIGIAITGASATGSFKVRRFGWIDYNDTAHGGALGATANSRIYLSATTGQLTITPVGAYPQAVGIAKTTTAANITRILICPEFDIMPFSYDPSTGLLTLTGKLYVNLVNTVAGGANCIYAYTVQATNPLTGTLRAGYFVATNGEFASSGTIRGIEAKARAALSDLTGGNVGTLEGASINADAKNKTVTTLRGAEIIMDGQAGAVVTLAVGIRISNNFQAAVATTSYGLHIYRDSFDYTADILLSKGGTITGDSYLNQDCRITGNPQFATIEIGHVDDTTLARVSAGNLSVQGNLLYRAGGTDVPVEDGGTGVSTLTTAYGLLAAGTLATGAVQTLPAGATTQLLVGGGAGALPAWGTDIPTAVTIGSAYIYRASGTDVPVADGGTGASTLTDHGILLGSGTDAITPLGEATNGQLPIGSTGADPVLATLTGTANQITVTNGAGTIILSTAGVTQAAAAGKVCDVTALDGGIATAQTQITYAADGTYNFDATIGKVDSITIANGRITAITVAAV